MQWAIGDWYNAIPGGDKKAACEKAGLDYQRAMNCGWVASVFKSSSRNELLSFKHHYYLATEELTEDQRASLMRLAEWGEPDPKEEGKRKPWTAARLTQERDTILGREKAPLPDFDEKVNQTVDSLPKNVGEKAGRVDCHGLTG